MKALRTTTAAFSSFLKPSSTFSLAAAFQHHKIAHVPRISLTSSKQNTFRFMTTASNDTPSSSSSSTPPPPPPPKFDAEMAHLYQRVAENHYHENGPWNLMLKAFQDSNSQLEEQDPSFRLLDLASGHGEPCTLFARTYPNAHLISTDFSNDMVELAKERTQHLSNVSVEQADMQDLRFESNSLDVITCSYGFMFPPDKDKAIAEAYRVLKPGGVLIATTWNQLPLMALVGDIMTKVLKLDQRPPPPPLNPMSLSEPHLFESMLEQGGFEVMTSTTSSYPFVLASDHDFSFKMVTMLIKDKLNELNEWDTARDAYNSLINHYAFVDADGNTVIDDNVFKLTVAKKPVMM